MKKNDFLIALEDILQREEPCHENDDLSTYEEWDSLSKMAIMAYFAHHFDIKLSLNDLFVFSNVSDLIQAAGVNIAD